MKNMSVDEPIDFASVIEDATNGLISVSQNGETVAFVISAKVNSRKQLKEAQKALESTKKKTSFEKLMTAVEEMNKTKKHSQPVREEDYYEKFRI